MTVTTEDGGRQNLFAKEPRMYVSDVDAVRFANQTYAEKAELANSRWAMLGWVALVGAYATTGQIIPGIW